MPESIKTVSPADPLRAHLRTNFIPLRTDETVAAAVDRLRHDPPGDDITYLYAVDGHGRLVGVVSTRRLLFSPSGAFVRDLVNAEVIAIGENSSVREACELLIRHKLLALPVVDAENRLVGMTDVQLLTEESVQIHHAEGRDDLFQRIGVHLSDSREPSPFAAFRQRVPWLSVNLVGGVICAVLAGRFEATLNAVVALAFFIPVVLNMAESVTAQSVSLALHVLAGEKPSWGSVVPRVVRELGTGALLGVTSGLAVALVAMIWQGNRNVALALLGGIGAGVTISAAVGLAVPVFLRLLKLDPHVAGGPVALAAADVLTMSAYLTLARFLLG